jgi:hypothetical protein
MTKITESNIEELAIEILEAQGYPPDMQKIATENVLKQAEMLAEDWSA